MQDKNGKQVVSAGLPCLESSLLCCHSQPCRAPQPACYLRELQNDNRLKHDGSSTNMCSITIPGGMEFKQTLPDTME
jgi:hypothetical protein